MTFKKIYCHKIKKRNSNIAISLIKFLHELTCNL